MTAGIFASDSSATTPFSATPYEGTGAGTAVVTGITQTISWHKRRENTGNHLLRYLAGSSTFLSTNGGAAEAGLSPSVAVNYNSTGMTLDSGDNVAINSNGALYASWAWRENAGYFEEMQFTGTEPTPQTVSHTLGVEPAFMIFKVRQQSGGWWVYHQSLGATKYLFLNSDAVPVTGSTAWNDTAPTSANFTVGNSTANYAGEEMLALLFADSTGMAKFGNYTGTGATNSIATGFRPKFIIIKRTDSAGGWVMVDSARGGNKYFLANTNDAEATATLLTFGSNGFELTSSNALTNASGGTYIYGAWA